MTVVTHTKVFFDLKKNSKGHSFEGREIEKENFCFCESLFFRACQDQDSKFEGIDEIMQEILELFRAFITK